MSGSCVDENTLLMSEVRGQRRMGRLVRDDGKAKVTQITTHYNQAVGISLRLQGKLGLPYNVKKLMVKYVLLC